MAEVFLTRHAIQRYREHVADVPPAAIWAALDCPAVRLAIEFGARFVKLSGGQRVVIQENRIVTILPHDHYIGALDRRRDGFFDDGEADAKG